VFCLCFRNWFIAIGTQHIFLISQKWGALLARVVELAGSKIESSGENSHFSLLAICVGSIGPHDFILFGCFSVYHHTQ